jgi:hypothetical protein
MVGSLKHNPRAMEILMDELAKSDLQMPKGHRFLRAQKLPPREVKQYARNESSLASYTKTNTEFPSGN